MTPTLPAKATLAAGSIGLLVGLGFGQGVAQHRLASGSLPPQGRWSPCYATQGHAAIPEVFDDWRGRIGVVLTASDMPNIAIVPRGPQKGDIIPPGCVAVEDGWGGVTLWRDGQAKAGRWVAHPRAAARIERAAH